jgi:hypothetical protein
MVPSDYCILSKPPEKKHIVGIFEILVDVIAPNISKNSFMHFAAHTKWGNQH